MSYNPNTGIVQDTGANDGVSIRDVQRALGVSSGDEGTLCEHPYIKALSRYKPIKDTLNGYTRTPQTLSDDDFYNRNWGFEIPLSNGIDNNNLAQIANQIIDGSYTGGVIMPLDDDTHKSIGNGWLYSTPVKNVNFHRITDFNGYCNRYENRYANTTFEANETIKMITKPNGSSGVFQIKMHPFNPRNFKSLVGLYYGILFYVPTLDTSSPFIRFWFGSEQVTKSATDSSDVIVRIDDTNWSEFLTLINNRLQGNVDRDADIYAIGVLGEDSNANNITGNHKPDQLATLRFLPGLGYDTLLYRYISGSGIYDKMLLSFHVVANGEIVKGSKADVELQLMSITNNYDVSTPPSTDRIIFYPAYFSWTTEVYNSSGVYDETRSHPRRVSIGTTGSIDVSNTESSEGHAIPKTTDVSSNNIKFNINWNGLTAVAGMRVVVKFWYITYNSDPGVDNNYKVGGQLVLSEGVLPRE